MQKFEKYQFFQLVSLY